MVSGRKVVIVGAGITGVTAAIELKRRGHSVTLLDPGPLPHPLAASTDISKAIRTAYGPDEDYTALAERSIPLWRRWNEESGLTLYHEVGMLFVRQTAMRPGDFEYDSWQVSKQRGRALERITAEVIRERFPAWSGQTYSDGIFERQAGYVESGRVIVMLLKQAQSLAVELREGVSFADLDEDDNRVKGVVLQNGERIAADSVIFAAGAWTPYLLPFTRTFFRANGQPVFHLRPAKPESFVPECFPVFGADISSTGYYGFPLNRDGVVKIANHGPGREMSPESADRAVTPEEEAALRQFLSQTFPALAGAQIVYTRICLYCDTHDGHFWIAPDPERRGLVIAAGDSGHAFKFAPVLGGIIADAAEGKENPSLQKFRWRPEVRPGQEKEAARYLPEAR
ncbi:MAG: hypothetical protein QOH39_1243 [Verrucomicrobiota bacterium]